MSEVPETAAQRDMRLRTGADSIERRRRAIRRATVARVQTFTRLQCLDALALDPQFLLSDDRSGVAFLQASVTQRYLDGIISAEDIEHIHHRDPRE